MAARSRAGGAARRCFPTLESGSAVRVGSVAGRSSRRRRLVSGRRRREAAEGARSCCSSGAMSTRVSRRRAASWSSIDTRESQRCSGTTCRRGGPGATARSGLLTTARGHRRSFLTSRRLRRASAREREKLRAPGLVCRRSFSTLYPTRRQRGRAVAASASFLGSGATARRYEIPARDRLGGAERSPRSHFRTFPRKEWPSPLCSPRSPASRSASTRRSVPRSSSPPSLLARPSRAARPTCSGWRTSRPSRRTCAPARRSTACPASRCSRASSRSRRRRARSTGRSCRNRWRRRPRHLRSATSPSRGCSRAAATAT